MSTWGIVVIVVAAVVLVAIVAYALTRGRARRLEQQRAEAQDVRTEARAKARQAEQARLAAEEQAEQARRQQNEAVALQQKANEVDPDVDTERAPTRAEVEGDDPALGERDERVSTTDR
jgi:F0F1-type ATP synthase membrane subunit b/b'